MSCWVPHISIVHLAHSNSTGKVTANVHLLGKVFEWTSSLSWCTTPVLTYKLLHDGSSVIFFSRSDWQNYSVYCGTLLICRIAGRFESLQLQVPLGAGTIWSPQLSAWHILFYFWKTEVSGHASELLGRKQWSLWVVICRRSQCICRHPSCFVLL